MPPLYGGSELIPQAALGDIPIDVQAFSYQHPPTWTYGEQTYTGIEAIEAAQAKLRLATLYQTGGGATQDIDPDFGTTPTFTETLAEEYIEFYEGESTTAEFLTDPIGTTTEGVVDVITDIVGTDIVVGTVSAIADPLSTIFDPITEPLGEGIEKLIVPVAILGGAYLLLK